MSLPRPRPDILRPSIRLPFWSVLVHHPSRLHACRFYRIISGLLHGEVVRSIYDVSWFLSCLDLVCCLALPTTHWGFLDFFLSAAGHESRRPLFLRRSSGRCPSWPIVVILYKYEVGRSKRIENCVFLFRAECRPERKHCFIQTGGLFVI